MSELQKSARTLPATSEPTWVFVVASCMVASEHSIAKKGVQACVNDTLLFLDWQAGSLDYLLALGVASHVMFARCGGPLWQLHKARPCN